MLGYFNKNHKVWKPISSAKKIIKSSLNGISQLELFLAILHLIFVLLGGKTIIVRISQNSEEKRSELQDINSELAGFHTGFI